MVLILYLARDPRVVREVKLGDPSCATLLMAGMAMLLLFATVSDWA